MATHVIPLINWTMQPGTDGAYLQPNDVTHFTNGRYPYNILVLPDNSAKIQVPFSARVPANYSGSPLFICSWTANATANDWEFDIEYSLLAVGQSIDVSADDETLNVADTAPGTAFFVQEATLTPTASIVAGDLLTGTFGRDGTDGGDGLGAAVLVLGFYFQYADA